MSIKINRVTTGPLADPVVCSHLTTSASDKENPSGRSTSYDHKCCKSGCVVQLQAAFKQSLCVVFGDRLRNSVITPVPAACAGERLRRAAFKRDGSATLAS